MDKMTNKEYQKFAKKNSQTHLLKNNIYAFIVGGIICIVGQVIRNILFKYDLDEKTVATATSILLVFLGSFLTGLGYYDKIGKIGGAGAAIPITGFANSIVSPAMEFKREGFIFGVAARMFSIAGPVLVYGVSSSIIVGLLYLILSKGR